MTVATAETGFRLVSTPQVHMPGYIAWAINGYAFKEDRPTFFKMLNEVFPTVPAMAMHKLLSKDVPYKIEDNAVVFNVAVPAPHERFNNLSEGDTLDKFEWFELVACRTDESDGVCQCEAGWSEFWGIYGRSNEGTEEEPEYLATAIHDAWSPLEAVQIARQIAIETGKGFIAGDNHFGHYPRRSGKIVPVKDFTEIAEDLTYAIHEDNEESIEEEDRRDDDFDNHPLAALREAFVDFSNYSGSDQLFPYDALSDDEAAIFKCGSCGDHYEAPTGPGVCPVCTQPNDEAEA